MSQKIRRFEDLIAWQKARALTKRIYETTQEGAFARDFGLKDQIRRAAVSCMSNIAEGFERSGLVEFQRYLSMAKGSCGELRAQLYIALDATYLEDELFRSLMRDANELIRVIGGLRASVDVRRLKRQSAQ